MSQQQTFVRTIRINDATPKTQGRGKIYQIIDMETMTNERVYIRDIDSKTEFKVGQELEIECYKNGAGVYMVNQITVKSMADKFSESNEPVEVDEEPIMEKTPELQPANEVDEEVQSTEEDDLIENGVEEEYPPTVVPTIFSTDRLQSFLKVKKMVDKKLVKGIDYMKITRRTRKGGTYSFTMITKSGWRKYQVAFGISTELIAHQEQVINNVLEFKVQVRAVLPAGQFADGVAISKMTDENVSNDRHTCFTTAHSNAVSRAISDLVGFGGAPPEEDAE